MRNLSKAFGSKQQTRCCYLFNCQTTSVNYIATYKNDFPDAVRLLVFHRYVDHAQPTPPQLRLMMCRAGRRN